jgi:predicted nuclease of predicted toxin-antitoxin system
MALSGLKLVWIRLGNCSTESIHLVLRNSFERITSFVESDDVVLELP